MTDFEAYQEYIQRRHNAFCKAVIRYAARDKILQLRRKWERQVSLDYLMDEKFVQFAGPEPDEEYPFTVCGQTVLLCNAALAAALSAQPKQTRSGWRSMQKPGKRSALSTGKCWMRTAILFMHLQTAAGNRKIYISVPEKMEKSLNRSLPITGSAMCG